MLEINTQREFPDTTNDAVLKVPITERKGPRSGLKTTSEFRKKITYSKSKYRLSSGNLTQKNKSSKRKKSLDIKACKFSAF